MTSNNKSTCIEWMYSSVLDEMNIRLVAMSVLQFWIITQLLFQKFYASTQAKSVVIGQKFLCVEANPQYVVNTTCKIHLIDRSTQLYSMNIELQPNVTLYNMNVNILHYKNHFAKQNSLKNIIFLTYIGPHKNILQIQNYL